MGKYNRSICSTCRHLADCVLTNDKRFITYCCDYEHIKQHHSRLFDRASEEVNYEELIFI